MYLRVNLDSSLNLESHFDKMYKRAAGRFNLLKRMESLVKRQSCQLVFDCLQDSVCTPFKGYFTQIEHNINTRNNGCSLKLPKAKLEFGRRSFAFQGPLVYNTLPRHLRNLNSRLLFKSNLKELFQQYSIIHNSFQSYKSIIFTHFHF